MATNHRGQYISDPYLNVKKQLDQSRVNDPSDARPGDADFRCTCSSNGECSNCRRAMSEAGVDY